MSSQRDRFEAAWLGDVLSLEWNDAESRYYSQEAQKSWEWFQKGEASGLELAARAVEDANTTVYDDPNGHAAELIRALMARGGE